MRWCAISARVLAASSFWVGIALAAPHRGAEPQPSPTPILPDVDLKVDLAREWMVGDRLPLAVESAVTAAEIKDSDSEESQDTKSQRGWKLIGPLELVFTKGGEVVIPSLTVHGEAGGAAIARTRSVIVRVKSAIAPNDQEAKEIVPPRPPVSVEFPWPIVLGIVVLSIALVALLTWAGMKLIRRWKAKYALPPPPPPPPRPEDEVALEALSRIESEGAWLKGRTKWHYFAVSEEVKRYLGKRYGFDALESTSAEVLVTLAGAGLAKAEALDQLETLFRLLDRVKFTDWAASEDEPKRIIQMARELIESTRKRRDPHAIS